MRKLAMFTLLFAAIKMLTGCTGGTFFFHQGYNVSGGKVHYKNAFPGETFEVPDADVKTFKIIPQAGSETYNSNTDFATDKNKVYYHGFAIPGSDGGSFTNIDLHFAKDKNQCYFNGEIITNADPATFVVKDETFSTDKNNVYIGTALMDNNASVFEKFDNSSIVHTANAVSAFGIIKLLPGATFKHLAFNYFAIDDQVYFQNTPIIDADVSSFKALDDFFWATAKHVYYRDKIIVNANPATYKLLPSSPSPYGKDNKHIFFFEKTIEGADPATFEIINIKFQCARDKHWAYNGNIKIKNVTAADLTNKKECTQCNETAIYFSEK